MAAQWEDRTPSRPDRYLDWEELNRSCSGEPLSERWCSVLVQCSLSSSGSPAANLIRLRDEIMTQRPPGPFTIKINSDEAELLNARIAAIEDGIYTASGPEDAGLQFFIYLPESRAYTNGRYAQQDYYMIRLVGPPIEGLQFNPISIGEYRMMALIADRLERTTQVAVGIIDDSIAFANERFRTRRTIAGQTTDVTRIAKIWLQDLEWATPGPDHGVAFGTRLSEQQINTFFRDAAAQSGSIRDIDVYRRAGVVDFSKSGRNSMARRSGHGTVVLDLACGFSPDTAKGMERPIFAVQLPDAATADTSGVTMASYVLQGLRQIMLWADSPDDGVPLPLVVNFSYGIMAGPKDGTHDLEREIDRLVSHRNKTTPTAVVLPSGNSLRSRTTARVELAAGATHAINWVVQPDDATPSFLEIWFEPTTAGSAAPFDVAITPPLEEADLVGQPTADRCMVLVNDGRPICGVYYDPPASALGRRRASVFVAINPTKSLRRGAAVAPSGAWRVVLINTTTGALVLDLFIQRDDTPTDFPAKGRQSYFDHVNAYQRVAGTGDYTGLGGPERPCPITAAGTLSAIGTGKQTVLVGAANIRETIAPADYTASGPTIGKVAPDFSAIVDEGVFSGTLGAGTASGTVVSMRGTSAAAPQVTRQLADVMASVAKLKNVLGAANVPDPQLGFATLPMSVRADIPSRRRPGDA
jgi:hypothetical protein